MTAEEEMAAKLEALDDRLLRVAIIASLLREDLVDLYLSHSPDEPPAPM